MLLGGYGGALSGALLPGLRAVQPVLGDGAGVAGLHQVHALGAQVDAVVFVWEEGEMAVRTARRAELRGAASPRCQPWAGKVPTASRSSGTSWSERRPPPALAALVLHLS